jgi:glycosyltransferase involved in cell wall biosynthesis
MNKDPIKIVFSIAALVVGGAEKQLFLLLSNIDRTIYQLYIITYGPGPWDEKFIRLGIPVIRLPYHKGKLAAILQTYRWLRFLRPTIVHTLGVSSGFVARLAAIFAKVPIIITSERSAPQIRSVEKQWVDKLLGKGTSRCITNSYHSGHFYVTKKILPASKVTVIRNGINITEYSQVVNRSDQEFAVGYIADMRPEKNHCFLLDGVKTLFAEVPGARLHLAGDGPLRPMIEGRLRELGIESRAFLHGWVQDINAFLQGLNAYAHISLYEGLPNAVMEAMASGLPCVVSNTTGSAELVEDGKTGLVTAPDCPEELGRALIRVARNPEWAQRLGQNARLSIQQHFSIATMVEKTLMVYNEELNRT